jgi:hypothetical protein
MNDGEHQVMKESASLKGLAASSFKARSVYFLLGGTSVQEPCATSDSKSGRRISLTEGPLWVGCCQSADLP